MKTWKVLRSTLALCVALTGGVWAQAQDWSHQDRRWTDNDDRDHARHRNDRQDDDRDHDRRDRDRGRGHWRDRDYRRGSWGDRDRDDSYRNRGYGFYGGRNYGRSQAFDIGYRDGILDGRNDARTGHSFRPQQDDNYKHADRGYDSSQGDKNAYKQNYRSGYTEGYRSGYGQRY